MKQILLIGFGLCFLIFWLIVGYPLEINNLSAERIITILFFLIIVCSILVIYRSIIRMNNKIIKISLLVVLIGVSLIYSWIGLWTFMISYDKGPIWEDTVIYTNNNGDKVISQFRETSGSIYDYRERFILGEFSYKNRISIEWAKKRMHGIWKAKVVKNDSIYIENFNRESD